MSFENGFALPRAPSKAAVGRRFWLPIIWIKNQQIASRLAAVAKMLSSGF